jgi:hypothetical protein
MKFIVRGKSVDFRNREGSSPSIPNNEKGLFYPLTYPIFSFRECFKISYVSHSLYPFANRSDQKDFSLITSLVIDMIYAQMNRLWARNPHY